MSSRRPIRTKEIQNPERILHNLIRDYVDGSLDDYTFLHRASVVKIDQIGGVLETTPPNPKNSIQARIITNARDKDLDDSDLPVFWPIFPHDVMPIKEGEHVYVIFEDAHEKTHGIWIGRVPEPSDVDSVNLTPGVKKYQKDPSNDFSAIGAEQAVQDTDSPPTIVQTSQEFVAEDVPRFRARVGDRVIEGSNNTLIVCGRDRPSDPTSGKNDKAGTVDLVVGRSGQDDMSMADDKSRIYVSMNTDGDGNFGINVGSNSGPGAFVVVKSDQVRIVARNGMKLIVEGGDVTLEANNIILGNNAEDQATAAQKLVDYLQNQAIVNTPAGPGKIVMPPDAAGVVPFSFASTKVKVKL